MDFIEIEGKHCTDTEISQQTVQTLEECQTLCYDNAECVAAEVDSNDMVCYLKATCDTTATNINVKLYLKTCMYLFIYCVMFKVI